MNATTINLISGLELLPLGWALTPVDGNKRPYRDNWQKEAPISRDAIVRELKGRARGYGIRTGVISGGILAIDADGHAAEELLQKMSTSELPDTVIFSSGKPGRRQLLYLVPPEYWEIFKTIKLKTGVKGDDGKEQQLEFRWDGCQSVLPPSVHPETGAYHWRRSPQDVEIAECPTWVVEMMLNRVQPAPSASEPRLKQPPTKYADKPPLEIFLGNKDLDLIVNGAADGSRNDSAQKLSLNLVATARRLYELGIDYQGAACVLYERFCANCIPPLGSDVKGEAEGWWRKAEAVAKRPSLDDEKLQGCYQAWLNKQRPQAQQGRIENMPIADGEVIYSEDERLRLALLDLSQEKDKIARTRKRAQICSHYRISKAEVEELIQETERKTSRPALKRMSLSDLLNHESEELSWLIPELLPKGELVILGGAPKAGKTLMAIDAAFAIATGEGDFLGMRCDRGKVLFVSNDASPRSTKSQLIRRGFRESDSAWLEIVFDWTIDKLYELEQTLADFRPDLVIIDSLKSISVGSVISENSAEFSNNIYALRNLFTQYRTAGILIHHTGKNPDALGVGKLRGSSAIAGAGWGTWLLDCLPKPDPNNNKKMVIDPTDPKRMFSAFIREGQGQLIACEFNPENSSYLRTDLEVINEQNSISDRIMSVLRLNPSGLSGRSIIECLGMSQEEGRGVYTSLSRMEAKLLISTIKSPSDKRVTLYISKNTQHANVTDCKYSTEGGDSLSPPHPVSNVEYSPESLTHNGLQNTQQKNQNTQQPTENTQQLFDTLGTVEDLNPLPAMDDSVLLNNFHTGGGEGVSPEVLNNSTESPTLLTLDEPISLMQVELDGGDPALYIGSTVEIRNHFTGQTLSSGTMSNWDKHNGIAAVNVGADGMIEYSDSRDLFVIAL
ncbi:bifunctional DNA primase/polymerase [Tolypothrix sp. VBCCA 56010]|uniref:bifunctional DNA primase/polymerase n=1 Tax=Tolypothrix sp. VBCCA 56010 TaxID=3137731 RepID=UPI003D7D13BC